LDSLHLFGDLLPQTGGQGLAVNDFCFCHRLIVPLPPKGCFGMPSASRRQ
jgi:hypothetical protein